MANFKQTVNTVTSQLNGELTHAQKATLFAQSKRYILVQQLLAGIEKYLTTDEEIKGVLPLANLENTAVFTTGVLGFSAATTPEAKNYLKHFHDTRGNRLLLFTNTRIIFLFPLEFFESQTFFSYPYTSIKAITMKANQQGIGAVGNWTLLDFQSDDHIFTETLSDQDAQKFQEIKEQIPDLRKIPIKEKAVRRNYFDSFVNNLSFCVKIGYAGNLLWILLFFFLLFGIFFRMGTIERVV